MGCSSGLHVGSSTGLISKSFQPTNYPSTSTGALGKVFVNTVAWMCRCEVWFARRLLFFFTAVLKRRSKKHRRLKILFIVAETIESTSTSTATSFRIKASAFRHRQFFNLFSASFRRRHFSFFGPFRQCRFQLSSAPSTTFSSSASLRRRRRFFGPLQRRRFQLSSALSTTFFGLLRRRRFQLRRRRFQLLQPLLASDRIQRKNSNNNGCSQYHHVRNILATRP